MADKRRTLLLAACAHISFSMRMSQALAATYEKLDAAAVDTLAAKAEKLGPLCSNSMPALPPAECPITAADLRPVGNYYPPDYKQHVANALRPRGFVGYAMARHNRRRNR